MKHILVVEDEPYVRDTICALVKSCGFTVSSASEGHEALSMVEKLDFDLVITDLVMPGMEGVETMAALRKLAPELQIIAMSGRDTYLDLARVVGARKTLLKPFSREKLYETIQSALAA